MFYIASSGMLHGSALQASFESLLWLAQGSFLQPPTWRCAASLHELMKQFRCLLYGFPVCILHLSEHQNMSDSKEDYMNSLPERRTAPLPFRRRSSARLEDQSRASSSHVLTPSSSIPSEPANNGYLSPPRPTSRNLFQFGQSEETFSLDDPTNLFTFRALHNVTPVPAAAAPSEQPSISAGLEDVISAPSRLMTADQELPQPLHTLFPDEKVVTDGNLDVSPGHETYDVRNETAPRGKYFSPAFQAALQCGLDTAKKIVNAIEHVRLSLHHVDDDLQRLLRDATKLSTFESANTRTVGVLGDSGEGKPQTHHERMIVLISVGKSSLINSLLHIPEIAKTVSIIRCLDTCDAYSALGRYRCRLHLCGDRI